MALALRQKFCQTHPTYALRRAPTGACKTCWRVWRLKNRLYRALATATNAVERLYQADEVQVRAAWSGGRGTTKAIHINSVGLPDQEQEKP